MTPFYCACFHLLLPRHHARARRLFSVSDRDCLKSASSKAKAAFLNPNLSSVWGTQNGDDPRAKFAPDGCCAVAE